MFRTAARTITLAALSGQVAAQTDYSGAGGSIPDAGGPSFPLASTIIINDTGSVADINVTLNGAAHTFVADLIVTLSHAGTSVVLINSPGFPENGNGYSWNLLGDYTWDDSATTSFEDIGVQASTFTLPSGSYAPENALAAFNGLGLSGAWTLTISDNAGLDAGSIQGWTLTATVPAPVSPAIFGLGGLVATRRRR